MRDGAEVYKTYTQNDVIETLRSWAQGLDVPDKKHPLAEVDEACIEKAVDFLGIKYTQLAKALGIHRNTASKWVRNPCGLSLEDAGNLLSYLANAFENSEVYKRSFIARSRPSALAAFCEQFVFLKGVAPFIFQRDTVSLIERAYRGALLLRTSEIVDGYNRMGSALAQVADEYLLGVGDNAAKDIALRYKTLREKNKLLLQSYIAFETQEAMRLKNSNDSRTINIDSCLLSKESIEDYRRFARVAVAEVKAWADMMEKLLERDDSLRDTDNPTFDRLL